MAFPKIGYRSILPSAASLTASSSTTGFPISNIADRRPAIQWIAGNLSAQTIDADMGSAVTADYFAIAAHNLIAENITLDIKADSFTPPTTVRATILPADYPTSGVYIKEFASQNLRYWRFSLSAASVNPAFIGVIYLGQIFTFTENFPADLDPNMEEVASSIERGETGHALGAITRTVERPLTLALGPAGADWSVLFSPSNFFNDFWKGHARKMRPFFFHPNIADATGAAGEPMFLVCKSPAHIDRPLVGERYSRRRFSFQAVSAVAEAA